LRTKKIKQAITSKEKTPEVKSGKFPIVGIGASAGGLEALELFLKNVPENTGMAYVVIQHLDPTQKGMLPELLQRIANMKVFQVEDLMKVRPDCVYVIPPNKTMSIFKGVLHLFEPVEAYETVKAWDLETNNIVWLAMAPANNTDVMLARPGFNSEFEVNTISELVDVINAGTSPTLKVAIRDEWYERADGWSRFKGTYGLNEDNVEVVFIGMGLEYDSLRESQVDISFGFATDGRIAAFGLDVVEDDQSNFAVYNPAPTIRKETLDIYPGLEELINGVSVLLTNEQLRELNQSVDVDGRSIDEVAREFLTANGFID